MVALKSVFCLLYILAVSCHELKHRKSFNTLKVQIPELHVQTDAGCKPMGRVKVSCEIDAMQKDSPKASLSDQYGSIC